ncbi:hypothetical protein TNCV_179301 [Trichonephila clavipes]|nr:hypothetical protein TNCV_179301 [Trichonephila clavipes]
MADYGKQIRNDFDTEIDIETVIKIVTFSNILHCLCVEIENVPCSGSYISQYQLPDRGDHFYLVVKLLGYGSIGRGDLRLACAPLILRYSDPATGSPPPPTLQTHGFPAYAYCSDNWIPASVYSSDNWIQASTYSSGFADLHHCSDL